MKLGSLCTGYAGLDMAAERVFNARIVWHAEKDPDASKVLAHHWPDVPNLGDITTTDWSAVEPVDMLTAGFPCQDVSSAGKRAGIAAGTRSGLWSRGVVPAIDALRPPLVIIENVRGLLSARADSDVEPCPWCLGDRGGDDQEPVLRALGAVLGDLADLGYDAVWEGVPAAAVGAPHLRWRVFILAWSVDDTAGVARRSSNGERLPVVGATAQREHAPAGVALLPTPDATHGRKTTRTSLLLPGVVELLPTPTARLGDPSGRGASHPDRRRELCAKRGGELDEVAVHLLPTPTALPYGNNQSASPGAAVRPSLASLTQADKWGEYAAAVGRWEHVLGRLAPEPTEPGQRGQPRLSPRFVEFLMGLPEGWVTGVQGITRNAALRILGNGVVPQQAVHALTLLQHAADGEP